MGGFDESQKFNVDDTDIGPRAWINGISCILKTKPHLIHLGKNKRKNIQNFCWKFKFFFSGFGRVILKNYKFRNVLICFPLFFIFVFLKTLKQALYRRSFLPIYSFIRSIYIFLSNLSDTIKKRKEVQSKRKIEKDIFLDIENPF